MPRDEVGNGGPGRVLSTLNCRTSGGANGSCCIEIRKPHSLSGQRVDHRRLVELVTKTTDIRPPHVIDKEEEYIRRALFRSPPRTNIIQK